MILFIHEATKKIALNANEKFKKRTNFSREKKTTDNASQLSKERDRIRTEFKNVEEIFRAGLGNRRKSDILYEFD